MAVSKESRDKAPVTPEGRPRDRSQSEESRDGPGREERARKDDDPERRHRDNDDDRRRADDDDKPGGREASEDARAAKDKYGSNVCETCQKEVGGGKAGMRLHKETSKLHWQYVYWQRGMPWEQAKARATREWEKAMSPSTVPNRPRRRRDDDDDGFKGDHKSAPKLRSRSRRSRGAEKGKSRRRSRDTEKGKSRSRRGRSRSPRLRKGITKDEENLVLRHAALIQKERAYREKKKEEKKAASAAKAPAKAPAQKKKADDETSGSYEYVTETDDDLEAGKAKQAQQAASDKKKRSASMQPNPKWPQGP